MLTLYTIIFLYLLCGASGISVMTFTGIYVGTDEATNLGSTIHSFNGIRYAHGDRFKLSTVVPDSNLAYQAKLRGPPCIQRRTGNQYIGEEDCFFLNIFTPNVNGSLPVIVHIHGGAWKSGEANAGHHFYMNTGRVVLVDIQYRLGVFGFADFNSLEYPSNLGLKDQVVALRWIQRNIFFFGGDPRRVTLQGESAGGASIGFHMASPLSKNLFIGGISQSGTSCSPWAIILRSTARQRLKSLIDKAGCPLHSVPDIIETPADSAAMCLIKLPPHQLLEAVQELSIGDSILPFRPVVENSEDEGAFITFYPWEQPTIQVPWISGVNSNEAGSLNLIDLGYGNIDVLLRLSVQLGLAKILLPEALLYKDTAANPELVSNLLLQFYNNGSDLTVDNISKFVEQAGSNAHFIYPNYLCHKLHYGSPSFNYLFDHVAEELKTNTMRNSGVFHTEELPFIFTDSNNNIRHKDSLDDRFVSETLVELFITFAESKFPEVGPLMWEPWDPTHQRVLLIENATFKMIPDPHSRNISFWSNLPFRNKQAYWSDSLHPHLL